MSTDNSEQQPELQQEPADTVHVPPRWPVSKRATAGVLATVVTAAAVGVGIAASSGTAARVSTGPLGRTAGASTYPSPGGLAPAQLPQRRQPSRYRDASTSATLASKAQQVGVVDIYTVLSDGSQAAGTGIVISPTGEIVTNNHVIEDSTRIRVVVVSTGRAYAARVRGTDATDDVAVLQLKGATGLATVTVDSSGDVQSGDQVTGVGNAGGVGGAPSAAAGTVLAVGRTVSVRSESTGRAEHLSGLIKVAADIQSGDSGGPLYDAAGEVIGIDTAASSARTPVLGFAIPITTALAVADTIDKGVATSTVSLGYPGFLGVELLPAADTPSGTSRRVGATIEGVVRGSAADGVGLSAGDTITAVDGTSIASARQLSSVIKSYRAGQSVKVTWTSPGGVSRTADATLARGAAA